MMIMKHLYWLPVQCNTSAKTFLNGTNGRNGDIGPPTNALMYKNQEKIKKLSRHGTNKSLALSIFCVRHFQRKPL